MLLGAADGDEVKISHQDYGDVIVSFWKDHTLCLGVLIRSDWVLVIDECYNKLLQFPEFLPLFGGYVRKDFFPQINIVNVATISTNSRFIILVVSSST